jgi:glycerophosphoryl diester phosphodiesterase
MSDLSQYVIPRGFRFGACKAGLKASGRADFALIVSDTPATAAAAFTANRVTAAPLTIDKEHLRSTGGKVRVVAINAERLWSGVAVKPLLSSFQPDALAAAQATVPTLPPALLLDELRNGWLDEAKNLACVAVVANHKLLDANVIAQIHAAGMRSLCYTVNETADAQRLLAAGIDGLITDAVDRFSPGSTVQT